MVRLAGVAGPGELGWLVVLGRLVWLAAGLAGLAGCAGCAGPAVLGLLAVLAVLGWLVRLAAGLACPAGVAAWAGWAGLAGWVCWGRWVGVPPALVEIPAGLGWLGSAGAAGLIIKWRVGNLASDLGERGHQHNYREIISSCELALARAVPFF